MAIDIVKKPVTQPMTPQQHRSLVPLRVVEIRHDRLRDATKRQGHEDVVEVGDILFAFPYLYGHSVLFNCTESVVIEPMYYDNGAVLCLRAYDVAQIVLSNDNEPAPVE